LLITRDKVAQATSKANEILSKTTASGALTVMERMENKVQEREAKAAALADMGMDSLDKQFKNFEGKSNIDQELLALKDQLGMGTPKLVVKEPILLEAKDNEPDTVEAQEVREVKND
jgi:phage shock protein A